VEDAKPLHPLELVLGDLVDGSVFPCVPEEVTEAIEAVLLSFELFKFVQGSIPFAVSLKVQAPPGHSRFLPVKGR
jgi:hypothetical protein